VNHALIFSAQNTYIARNLGAHRIAHYLREHEWDVEVIDYAGFIPYNYLFEITKSRITNDTVFVGFSDTWGTWHAKDHVVQSFHDLIKWINNNFPRVKIIVGSQKVNSSPIKADYYVDGYGENAILALVQHLLGTGIEKLKYTLYKDSKLIRGSDYPSLYMKKLFVRYEDRDFIKPEEQLGVEWSRGCKFECDFCNFFPLGVKGDNFRDVQDYIDNVKYLHEEFGVTTFFSSDSTANVSPNHLEMFGNETQRQLSFKPWICGFTRVDLMIAHPETWDSMIAMGYTGHHYGIETLNHKTGKSIKKGMHPDKVKQGLIDIDNYFSNRSLYRSRISLIAGLPYETTDSFLDGVSWIYNNLPNANVTTFPLWIPHPKSWDSNDRSLISTDYEKYGYVDLDPEKVASSMNWANNITGTNYEDTFKLILTHPLLANKKFYPSPWLIGEIAVTTNLSFEDAAMIKWSDLREVITGYSAQEIVHYDNAGVYQYLKNYVLGKLNYTKK
jgi:radical SAM superfamily enzyme YgiQ (UPF0313 family)